MQWLITKYNKIDWVRMFDQSWLSLAREVSLSSHSFRLGEGGLGDLFLGGDASGNFVLYRIMQFLLSSRSLFAHSIVNGKILQTWNGNGEPLANKKHVCHLSCDTCKSKSTTLAWKTKFCQINLWNLYRETWLFVPTLRNLFEFVQGRSESHIGPRKQPSAVSK